MTYGVWGDGGTLQGERYCCGTGELETIINGPYKNIKLIMGQNITFYSSNQFAYACKKNS